METKPVYILEGKDLLNHMVYYAGNWNDTWNPNAAKQYSLDDALAESRKLRELGGHYRVVRLVTD